MTIIRGWRCLAMLAVTLAIMAGSAQAAIVPESDVLLPWFEVDLERHEVGLATTFTVVNASANAVRSRFTVYTNWGIPVLEVPVAFARAEAITIDLRAWIADGVLPDRTLTPSELVILHAALTGNRSPVDGLFYGSMFGEGMAVGYVIAQTLDGRPDSLWGDTHSVDIANNYFEAETLTALTHGLQSDCKRHGMRFLNEGRLFEGDELIVWSGRRFSPSPTATPIGPKMKVTIGVYDQAGHHVQDCHRELIAVESVMVCHLDITPSIGWLDIATEDPTFILGHLHSTSQASAELHSYCLREDLNLEGPGITLEKKVDGDDADHAPGPKISVGDPIEYQYQVTNSGSVVLTAVSVTDDAELEVTCPKTTLAAGETMVCTAHAIALGCEQVNLGTATGTAPTGTRVGASDVAYYNGVFVPAVTLEMLVNDSEADQPPGPNVQAGDPLQWTFVVTNTGNALLEGISIATKNGETVPCPKSALEPGQSMTCSAESLALEGQQHEVGTVTAHDPCRTAVVATDPAYYFGRRHAPSITIKKYVGESDADTPPGPTIPVGTTIQWRFIVTNTGNVPLSGIVVTDDQGITPECPQTTLEPGESMICTASSIALPCQQADAATATGSSGQPTHTVSAQDVAHYFGEGHPAITLEMKLNGDPADVPPGPWIDENATILFAYEITNTGDVELTSVTASDDYDRTAVCPKTTLQPGESMTCSVSTLAVVGTHDIVGVAYGRPPCGDSVQAMDPAFYRGRGLSASIDVMKMTNGIHAEAPPGPSVSIGTIVQWTYVVTNTGTLPLTDVSVTDSQEVTVTCPKTVLEPAESMTCTANGIAQACQYSNTATAAGHPAEGETVSASDNSFYFGQHSAAITIDKKTNGEDAAEQPGPSITTGTTVQWTFVVTNSGDVALTDVLVTDDRAGAVLCPKATLAIGESMTCSVSGPAVGGQQRNVATATGKPPCGETVAASDASHYRGVTPGIQLEKLVNGEDADDAAHALQIAAGSELLWSFVVTNTGDVPLTDVAVDDTTVPAITCPKTTLDPAESMTCTAGGIADPGLDCNIGHVVGTSPQSVLVESSETACYFGRSASIAIEKSTNGFDADTPPGPEIIIGAAVTWTYLVTNTGNVDLTGVSVTDSRGVAVTCPKTALVAGESMTCVASGVAVAGQYSNIGTATGTPFGGSAVTANDPSHYYAVPVGSQGCTPGYWKNHTGSWPPTGYSPSQTVGSAFTQAYLYPALNVASLLDSLSFSGGPGVVGAAEILLRGATAALLNAAHPAVSYPRTPSAVVADVNTALATQNRDAMLALAAMLDADNNRGCPLH